ncbi:uncharacterized protein LOC112553981 [Pomacea canaliculata]|uniref:uncharacterized protein LOC112553981 n=1 Tax=Pomacea canaliculata TaxID=400727 RepID=UPI000D73E4AA|nr:uncharacterized protein LOC112553981 [Pomacea canaliculata]
MSRGSKGCSRRAAQRARVKYWGRCRCTRSTANLAAGMLPPGFKKDSRTWLHKNPKPRSEDVDKTAVLRRFLDNERTHEDCSPYFLVEHAGKQFKKDSRTWLHKSSLKKQQQQLKSRRKCPGPVAGDGCREPEFARSNTDVRIGLQDKLRHKGSTIHSSDCDILSNDHSMRNVLRKKRGDTALMHNIPTRRPYRTLSEERLGDEVNSIMAYNCLNTYSNSGERVTELADETTHAVPGEDNCNQQQRMYFEGTLPHNRYLCSYPSIVTDDKWRETVRVKSDTSSSDNSKGSMETLAPIYDDIYNTNDKGERISSPGMPHSASDKLWVYPTDSRSSVGSTCVENAQLKMMSLCASPPGSSCSDGSISEEDLKSSDVDM